MKKNILILTFISLFVLVSVFIFNVYQKPENNNKSNDQSQNNSNLTNSNENSKGNKFEILNDDIKKEIGLFKKSGEFRSNQLQIKKTGDFLYHNEVFWWTDLDQKEENSLWKPISNQFQISLNKFAPSQSNNSEKVIFEDKINSCKQVIEKVSQGESYDDLQIKSVYNPQLLGSVVNNNNEVYMYHITPSGVGVLTAGVVLNLNNNALKCDIPSQYLEKDQTNLYTEFRKNEKVAYSSASDILFFDFAGNNLYGNHFKTDSYMEWLDTEPSKRGAIPDKYITKFDGLNYEFLFPSLKVGASCDGGENEPELVFEEKYIDYIGFYCQEGGLDFVRQDIKTGEKIIEIYRASKLSQLDPLKDVKLSSNLEILLTDLSGGNIFSSGFQIIEVKAGDMVKTIKQDFVDDKIEIANFESLDSCDLLLKIN